jgi:predicted enzyme related to lactoylglutathione lyase
MKDALTWFEISTNEIQRSRKFYENVLGIKMHFIPQPEPMALFPAPEEDVKGALVQRASQAPGAGGTLVYLRVSDVAASESRVTQAGGRILEHRHSVPGVPGEMFRMQDVDGNIVGVHGL